MNFCTLFILIISLFLHKVYGIRFGDYKIHDLLPDLWFSPNPRNYLDVYCHRGLEKKLSTLFLSTRLYLNISSLKYYYYYGYSESEVIEKYDSHHSSWSFFTFSWETDVLKLDPFNSTCVGIAAKEDYEIQFRMLWMDYWKVLALCCGVLLFSLAPRLSNNSLFYYICGVCLGMSTSFLILVYMFSKLFPKKPMMYMTIVSGWTMGLYIIQFLWRNIRTIAMDYNSYVLWYLLFAGMVSFFVCYRIGPPTDPRSKNIIKWALQGAGLTLVYFSSEITEASITMIVIILCIYNIPDVFISKFKSFWKRKFPPKVKLLTEAEFHEQGVVETAKGLENLRGYCRSPNCNQWKTILKLKDSGRFARFMEGESHLMDAEILAYENDSRCEVPYDNVTDDESESEEENRTANLPDIRRPRSMQRRNRV